MLGLASSFDENDPSLLLKRINPVQIQEVPEGATKLSTSYNIRLGNEGFPRQSLQPTFTWTAHGFTVAQLQIFPSESKTIIPNIYGLPVCFITRLSYHVIS